MIEMALQKRANIFTGTRGTLAAAALSAAAMVSTFSGAAQADDARAQPVSLSTIQQCMPLLKSSQGTDINASSSAHGYSKFNPGSVAISIYPGADLEMSGVTAEQLGAALTNSLKSGGVDAECFVNNSHFENNGTSIAFHVHGLRISVDGEDTFNVHEIQQNPRILQYTRAEALMVKRHAGSLALAP
jgi:hypothetical protein